MDNEPKSPGSPGMDGVLERIERLRRFSGPPNEFWPLFLEESSRLVNARLGLLLLREEETSSWKKLLVWPAGKPSISRISELEERIQTVAEAAATRGVACEETAPTNQPSEGIMVGVRLKVEDERASVAVYWLEQEGGLAPEEAALRLTLLADSPAVYQLGHMVSRAKNDVVKFSEALDLMTLLNAEKRFMAAAMTFCNEIASRYGCDRVSLGWIKGDYVRVQAISHMERFEKKMEVVRHLELAMEEAFNQEEEIVWPRMENSRSIVRDHEAFSRDQGGRSLLSLTIRLDDQPVGVVTCERMAKPFSLEEVRGLRVLCDQAARRLGDLKHHDRWFGAKAAAATRAGMNKLFGPEHTFAKLLGLVICVALAFLIFGKMNYRVEAPFILKTDDLVYLPAPFDGYIDQVHVKIGDPVAKMAPVLSLDTRELLLEESTAVANLNRYGREAAKARSQNALADMKVALALEEQARARLELVRYHLNHAEMKAPFAGIVVEGDLKELLGAPVKKGDVLFKVALLDNMYAELKVDERDVHELKQGGTGEIAFVSRPDIKFPIRVERIDPVSVTDEGVNVYLVRASFPERVSPWWRPGMSGVAKVNIGRRNILWIFTHRTIDFLRIFFWW